MINIANKVIQQKSTPALKFRTLYHLRRFELHSADIRSIGI
jgi:hypothetical protein